MGVLLFVKEWWFLILTACSVLIWLVKMEGQLIVIKEDEKKNPVVRKDTCTMLLNMQTEALKVHTQSDRELIQTQLSSLSKDISWLKQMVENNHREMLDRIEDIKG